MSSSAVKPDEKNPKPPGAAPQGEVHPADEFDDDSTGGERTVAQSFEGFDLDPSMPLPISVPPPAMEKKEPPKTTGTQRMPPAPARPAAPAPRPVVAAPPRAPGPPTQRKPSAPRIPLPPPPSARVPVAPQRDPLRDSQPSVTTQAPIHTSSEPFDDDDPASDGPTMATPPGTVDFMGASAAPAPEEARPRKSPLAATGIVPMPNKPAPMADVDTIARLEPEPGEQEEATRAVSREELFRAQDAHVVVGDDAIGDEATLAVPPEKLEAMKATGPMHETREALKEAAFPPPPTPFSGPPGFSPLASAPMPMPGAPPQSWPQQHAADPGFRVPPPSAPFAIARNAQQAITGPSMHQQTQQPQPMHPGHAGQQPMWPPQAPTLASPMRRGGMKLTPQILALVAVGIVCLLIFFVGLYLFFTTKF